MASARIAVLFDAENVSCSTATAALQVLVGRGSIQIKRAVGDFSSAMLAGWIACGRDSGIELVLQPSLGKGKNGADIKLTIEAMDIVHQGHVDTIALVTRDRDFTPLALRLREAGMAVLGFASSEPNVAFRTACSSFVVIGKPAPVVQPPPVVLAKPVAVIGVALEVSALARLRQIAAEASRQAPVTPQTLTRAIVAAAPDLAIRLSGRNKFLKTLVAHGIVERVGSGPSLLVQTPRLQRAG